MYITVGHLVAHAPVSVLDDFDRAITDAVHAFKTFTRDPRFVAGAGASEMEMAKVGVFAVVLVCSC